MKYRNQGFTMTELMVSVGIASSLMAMALPSFHGTIQNNRIVISANELIGDLRYARSEAMKRGTRVVLCPSSDPTAASPSCAASGDDWARGWLVYADSDASGSFDNGTDTLLKVGQGTEGNLTLAANAAATGDIMFNPDASTSEGGSTARIAVCDERGPDHGRLVEVPPAGKARIANVSSCNSVS